MTWRHLFDWLDSFRGEDCFDDTATIYCAVDGEYFPVDYVAREEEETDILDKGHRIIVIQA